MKQSILKRIVALSLMAIAIVLFGSIGTNAIELVRNGGCEEGAFSSGLPAPYWTRTSTSTGAFVGEWPVGSQPYGSLQQYISPTHAPEGNRSCGIGLSTISVSQNIIRFYQDIAVPGGTSLTIGWKQHLSQQNLNNITPDDTRLRVLIRNTSDAILQTLYFEDLPAQTNEVRAWETLSFSLGTAYAGQTIRLEFYADVPDSNSGYGVTRGFWEFDAISANALAPTAAPLSLSGKAKDANGRPLGRVRLRIMDMNGNIRSAMTNAFGHYEFRDIEAGQTYAIEAFQKGIRFINNPRILVVTEDNADEDFFVDEPTRSKF